jgi:hypothetical protein
LDRRSVFEIERINLTKPASMGTGGLFAFNTHYFQNLGRNYTHYFVAASDSVCIVKSSETQTTLKREQNNEKRNKQARRSDGH